MAWAHSIEGELHEMFDELAGSLAWQDRQAMRFFIRQHRHAERNQISAEQRMALRRLYKRRWWKKLRRDGKRYARYRAQRRRQWRKWLRDLALEGWREYRSKANRYRALYMRRLRAAPASYAAFLENRRRLALLRRIRYATDDAARRRSEARSRWLRKRLKRLRQSS